MPSLIATVPAHADDRPYDRGAIALHWAVALAIMLTYGLGLARGGMPRGPSRDLITMLHMSFGMLTLTLVAVRLAWRAAHGRFQASPTAAALVARLGHAALYVAMVATPVLGVLMHWWKGRAIAFFGLFSLPSPFAPATALAKLLEEAHEVSAHVLMALVALHAAAALFHHYVLKDGVLGRMSPRRV